MEHNNLFQLLKSISAVTRYYDPIDNNIKIVHGSSKHDTIKKLYMNITRKLVEEYEEYYIHTIFDHNKYKDDRDLFVGQFKGCPLIILKQEGMYYELDKIKWDYLEYIVSDQVKQGRWPGDNPEELHFRSKVLIFAENDPGNVSNFSNLGSQISTINLNEIIKIKNIVNHLNKLNNMDKKELKYILKKHYQATCIDDLPNSIIDQIYGLNKLDDLLDIII